MLIDTNSQITDINKIVSFILAQASKKALMTVAIAGAPGSGKSTIAAELATRLGASCCIIPMDGFHLDNKTLVARGLLSVKGAPETFDFVGFAKMIDALKDGSVKHFPIFDRDIDSVIHCGGTVPNTLSVLLFEGNYLLFDEPGWSDLSQKWDMSIWLDVPEAILEERLTKRWLDQGMSPKKAKARAQMNDLANAKRVLQRALPATWIISN
jgi:fructokinase